jgi:hypothetical protein
MAHFHLHLQTLTGLEMKIESCNFKRDEVEVNTWCLRRTTMRLRIGGNALANWREAHKPLLLPSKAFLPFLARYYICRDVHVRVHKHDSRCLASVSVLVLARTNLVGNSCPFPLFSFACIHPKSKLFGRLSVNV